MISKENMDYLLNALNFYSEQYDKLADICFNDLNTALNEIKKDYLPANTQILPYGSYKIKSNYQILEPMEFYVVINGDKEQVLAKENQQKAQNKRRHKKGDVSSIKNIYQNIFSGSYSENQILTSFDVAKKIMEQMQKYLGENDIVYFINNVVFVKFKTENNLEILAVITVVYNFEQDLFEFKKYGISTKENSKAIISNIFEKNKQTNGNYLVLCKLIKMLELELIIIEMSTKYLSKKSLFVEQLLYNVPNSLYEENNYSNIFVNVTNYIKHCIADKLLLADNVTKMFPEHGYYAKKELKSFVKKLVYLCKHTDRMIKEAIDKYANTVNRSHEKEQVNNTEQNDKNIKKLGK